MSQAWYRKIQSLNLTKEYKDSSSSIGSWLKLFFGLPALPPSAVGDCFADILFPRIPDDPRASLFSDYIVSTYIDEFSEFPPAIWASDNIKGRTTNACVRDFKMGTITMEQYIHVFGKKMLPTVL